MALRCLSSWPVLARLQSLGVVYRQSLTPTTGTGTGRRKLHTHYAYLLCLLYLLTLLTYFIYFRYFTYFTY